MPDLFHVIVDDITYKIYVTYGEYQDMVSGKYGAKERAFQHIYRRICEFRGKNKPNFQVPKKESLLLVQANAQGFQDTQMSQDSLLITQDNYGENVEVTQQLFSDPPQSVVKRSVQSDQTCGAPPAKQMRPPPAGQTRIVLQTKKSAPAATYTPSSAQRQLQNRSIQERQQQQHIPVNATSNVQPKRSQSMRQSTSMTPNQTQTQSQMDSQSQSQTQSQMESQSQSQTQSLMQSQTQDDSNQSQELYDDSDITAEPESDQWSMKPNFDEVFYPNTSKEDLMYKRFQDQHQIRLDHAHFENEINETKELLRKHTSYPETVTVTPVKQKTKILRELITCTLPHRTLRCIPYQMMKSWMTSLPLFIRKMVELQNVLRRPNCPNSHSLDSR